MKKVVKKEEHKKEEHKKEVPKKDNNHVSHDSSVSHVHKHVIGHPFSPKPSPHAHSSAHAHINALKKESKIYHEEVLESYPLSADDAKVTITIRKDKKGVKYELDIPEINPATLAYPFFFLS